MTQVIFWKNMTVSGQKSSLHKIEIKATLYKKCRFFAVDYKNILVLLLFEIWNIMLFKLMANEIDLKL